MTLRRVQDLVINRLREDPVVAHMMLDEIMLNLKVGEHDTEKLLLRDLVHATLGFEGLAQQLDKPSKSLHRMLSVRGNPTISNMSAILACVSHYLDDMKEPA